MSNLKNKIFNSNRKPSIYVRCVDDILILANDTNEINIQQNNFQKNSVLNFMHELNKNKKISFLDVLIDTIVTIIITSLPLPTKKPSNNNSCTLNFKSECPF